MYPIFHPDRPYFVNLAYFYEVIGYHLHSNLVFPNELISLTENDKHSWDKQKHYLKYLDKFGPEEKLPGFRMTNQQMIEFIRYQKGCRKLQNNESKSYYSFSKTIFNCHVDKDEDEDKIIN